MSVEEMLAHLEGMKERKILRRVAAILFHRRAGFSANGMGGLKIPRGRDPHDRPQDGLVPRYLALLPAADLPGLALQRLHHAHGRSKEECDAVLDAIADECGIGPDDRSTLYSSTEYKKIRLRYFTDDYRQWKKRTVPRFRRLVSARSVDRGART